MGLFKKKVSVTKSLAMNGKDKGAIVGVKGYLLGQIIHLSGDEEILVGRDGNLVKLVIDNPEVMDIHCSIRYIQGEKCYEVINLSHGELIADMEEELLKGEKHILQPGTSLYIGSPENEIRLG